MVGANATTQKLGSGLTWNRLLTIAALVDTALIAAFGVVVRDREALGLAAVALLAIGFLRIRHGATSIVILGVILLDVLAFMGPAAFVNIRERQALSAILVPASLTAISLAGVIAATGSVIRHREPKAGDRMAPIVAQVAIAALALSVITAVVQQRDEPAAAQPGDIVVISRSASYNVADMEATGPEITFALHNEDLFWHTFTIDGVVDIGLPTRARKRATVSLEPGRYEFYCAVPGHRMVGMEGMLVVR